MHDIRWAASRYWSDDLLVMPSTELAKFVEGWSPYDIEILDAARPLSPAEVDALALAVNSHDMTTPLLPVVPGAGLYYGGHDDCYLHVETRDPTAVRLLMARLLALRAGCAVLDGAAETVTVTEPPADLVTRLLTRSDHWVGEVERRTPTQVTLRLAVTSGPWRLGDPPPDVMPLRLTLDLRDGTWSAVG